MEKIFKCSKCKGAFIEVDKHHPDKKNNPKITVDLCKDCHYEEHHEKPIKYGSDIMSIGYGIMPNKILFDKELSSTCKLLYVLISSLCAERGYCWANNKFLSEKLDISITQISTNLSKLEKYLRFENRTSYTRRIYISNIKENLKEPLRKVKGNLKENLKHNTIKEYYNNNINTLQPCGCGKEINELIDLFKSVNPTIKFGNKTQRKAIEELLGIFDYEKLKSMIEITLKHQGKDYMPTITTPYQFNEKLGAIKIYFDRLKNNKYKITSV